MSSYHKVSATRPSNFAAFVRTVLAACACRGAAGLCPSEQHAIWQEEARLPKRSTGLQGVWSCGLTRVSKTRTERALFQCAQLGSAAACITPPCKAGRMFPETSSGTNCYRACNPFPAPCWLARGVPSIPKPAYSIQQSGACSHPGTPQTRIQARGLWCAAPVESEVRMH